jgi:elongation factor P
MINYNEIKPGKIIELDGEPYEVLSSNFAKKNRQKPVNQVKLKNLISGSVVEKAFRQTDKISEADISKKEIKYLYTNRGESMFCEPNNPRERFSVSDQLLEGKIGYLKENDIVDALIFDEELIGITLPIKMDFTVTEAPPNFKGNTASGGDKVVILETGLKVTTPLFIEVGDVIRVNTENNTYAERVSKV